MSDTTSRTPDLPAPPRRGRGALILLAAAAAGAALGGGAVLLAVRMRGDGHAAGAQAGGAQQQLYQCPMHPSIVQDHPGDCPICGMKLVPMAAPAAPAAAAGAAGGHDHAAADQWQCPMHPSIVQDHPGDCPICGMKLVKVAGGGDAHAEHGATPEGMAAVTIDPARQQLIGLRTAPVGRGALGGAWRTAGRVAIDETRVHHVNVKVGGFIDHDHGNFVGKAVRKGEPLFSMYSPELLAAQEELLLALRTQRDLAASGAAGEGEALVKAARRKLQLWDVSPAELARLERTGEASKTLVFHAPASGVITKRDVVPGMSVEPGAMPYEIADLSRVWVLADVYESELRHVALGMPATLQLKAYPNRSFEGRVAFVDPLLDPRTRTAKVRIEVPNPKGELKPEMFGEVTLRGKAREGLVIPADAVIDSGTMQVVFVAMGEGRFQPRQVRLGDGDGRHVEVVEGLHEGEQVVTGANFLVDSESRLRASLAAMAAPAAGAKPAAAEGAAPAGAADPHAGHGGR